MVLIYIKDLSNELSSNPWIFADATGHTNEKCVLILFLLSKLKELVSFSRKTKKPSHLVLILNNIQVIQTPYQKHLGLFLDEKLNLGEHLRYIANKVNTSIGRLL